MIGLLFDIDGTLVDTQGQGVDAFVRGIRETWQIDDDLSWITFAGATDLDILERIAKRCGIDTQPDRVAAFFSCYAGHLRNSINPERVRVLPSVRNVLESLAAKPQISLGLVTGNARETAFLKLQAANLDHYFPDGGFGDQDPVRAQLVRLAMGRMTERVGEPIETFAVIGDTPNDINAAAACGILPVGVSTGRYNSEELNQIHPDAVVLSNLDELLNLPGLFG